ncbi:odorant receptor 63a [Aedes albopictus]|uniref:Odorant receptor n=1 Tax=Aedes albopictus TaxID=7160 RepID=A0ABM1ZE19_AEDAL
MFLKKTAQSEALQVGLQLLTWIGLQGTNRKRIWRYYFIVGWLLGNVILPKALLGSGDEGFDSLVRSLAEMAFFSDVCIAVGIFVTRLRHFERMVQILKEIFDRYETKECVEEIRRFNRRMDIFAKSYIAYIGMLVFLFFIPSIVWNLYMTIFVSPAHRSSYVLLMEVQYFYLDIRHNFVHYLLYFVLCGAATLCSAYQSCIKGTIFLTALQYGAKLFELLHLRISRLDEVEAGDRRREELRRIIELHNMTLKYTELLEETITFIMINQVLNCMAIWCMFMVYLSSNYGPNGFNVAVLFVVFIVEMVVYCVSGTHLSENAFKVGSAIYHYPWYLEPADMQRDLRFMIQRAQRPCGITAAKFYFVNIERLGILVQASYSYYLLLKNGF